MAHNGEKSSFFPRPPEMSATVLLCRTFIPRPQMPAAEAKLF